MPPNFGEIIYGATAWSFKHPISIEEIVPTFQLARQIFNQAGFSGRCSIEGFSVCDPEGKPDLRYAEMVNNASQKQNLIPVTTIFRPMPNPSMVASDRKVRKHAVRQSIGGVEYAVAATPKGLPVVVNGPFQIVHGSKREGLGETRRGYLIDCLKEIGEELEKQQAYAALEILRPSETHMSSDPEYWLGLLDKVNSPRIGILVDTVHYFEGNGNDATSMLRLIDTTCQAGRCYSVHLSNSPRTEWEEAGEIAKHTVGILRVLQKHNCHVTVDYEGFDHSLDKAVGIERREDQQDQIEVAKRSMAYLAGHVKSLTG